MAGVAEPNWEAASSVDSSSTWPPTADYVGASGSVVLSPTLERNRLNEAVSDLRFACRRSNSSIASISRRLPVIW
jgi:hypothetical protein